jgi:hypothetical protein
MKAKPTTVTRFALHTKHNVQMITMSPEILKMNEWSQKSQMMRGAGRREEQGAVRHGERQKLDNPTPEGLAHVVSDDGPAVRGSKMRPPGS